MRDKERREIPPQVQDVISGIEEVGLTEARTLYAMEVVEGVVVDFIIGTAGCYNHRSMRDKFDALIGKIAALNRQDLPIMRMMPDSFLAPREGSVLDQPVPEFFITLTPENLKPC